MARRRCHGFSTDPGPQGRDIPSSQIVRRQSTQKFVPKLEACLAAREAAAAAVSAVGSVLDFGDESDGGEML